MGRLSIVRATYRVAAAVILLLLGCNDRKNDAPIVRREAVIAPTNAPQDDAIATHTAKPVRRPSALCSGPALGKVFPSHQLGHGEAPGAQALGTTIRVGHGKWVWLNLWAAWCAPCKEELPRLQAWREQLSATTDFRYLSLDDDQRQFLRFLSQQPATGLRSSYWLPEGKTRVAWLEHLEIDTSPELPIQILINPQGKVHCIVQGVVEDDDLSRVKQIVAKP